MMVMPYVELVADPAMQDANDEQLILQRTESLASTNPLATSLLENTRLLVSSARYTFLIFCISAFFLGITTATAFFAPGTPVNIGMAWLMLVGINLVSLFFIVLSTAPWESVTGLLFGKSMDTAVGNGRQKT